MLFHISLFQINIPKTSKAIAIPDRRNKINNADKGEVTMSPDNINPTIINTNAMS